MKNMDVVTNFNNLCGIISKNEKYPVKLSFAIYRNVKILEPLTKDYEEAKGRLLETCGVKNIDGTFRRTKSGEYEISKEHKKEWESGLKELLDIDINVELQKVTVDDYPENVEPVVIMALDFMTKSN